MITHATRTDPGRRPPSGDRLGVDPRLGTFVVADGIGGLADGGATAQAVVDRWPAALDGASDLAAATATLSADLRAGARHGPGTTGAASALVHVRGATATVVHLGDSRVYLVRAGRARLLTADHTDGGGLTRFLGMADAVPAVSRLPLRPGDRLLLCTDGLALSDAAIGRALGAGTDLDTACTALVEGSRRGGATDDIAVIVVDCGGS